jgi:hypothetical protein
MDQARYYPGTFDVNSLAMQLASNLQLRAYQAQWFGSGNQMMVQVRKGGDASKILGMQAALTVMLTQHPTGLLVTIGAGSIKLLWVWPDCGCGRCWFRQPLARCGNRVCHLKC